MRPRAWTRLAALLLPVLAACTINAREPLGEQIWITVGEDCEDCGNATLHREDESVEYRFVETPGVNVIRVGTLTEQGLAEYRAASAGLGADQDYFTCSEADGVDVQAVALDGDSTFEVTYCAGDLDTRVERFANFFDRVLEALRECESNAWVDAC